MGRATSGGQLRIGTSGWQYKHWKGVFYPDGVPQRRWLEYFAERFDTVEVNSSFYHLPRETTFDAWRQRVADDFCFVLKYSRFGTHIKRLADPHEHVDIFVERARRLGGKLGPILVQLPPSLDADPARLSHFLDVAPSDLRWAVEFRNPAWLRPDVYSVLREHAAALCIHDLIADHPAQITADWVYLRYHGSGAKYAGCYSDEQLAGQAERIGAWLADGRDVFAYFNNDAHGYAVRNALQLGRYCRGE